ncbi:hypothetical protein OPKNFCMD_1054 [Methylobacterium crusticola]|uniref:Uncharacterized protein n=1 Tax=Methylobacterium crusticola TaxID=1697972 RepID=A0ABQ4QUH8_9HYPH|nr:hypothetical protein [Methylobacterium crusticola]GJD48336.1 hypothetical protein OPKNFCMD_1054 [Methylobacterium crusticola]
MQDRPLRDGPAEGRHLLTIGATAGALALASHLLRRDARAQVTMIERRPERCRALRRGDFPAVLGAGGLALPPEPERLRLVAALHEHGRRLHVAEGTCLALGLTAHGVAALSDDGTTYLGRGAALTFALGARAVRGPAPPPPPGARTAAAVRALRLDPADLPLGGSAAFVTRRLRGLVREAAARGVAWREAVDGLRLHAPALWHSLPEASQDRLLRHGRAAWDRLAGAPAPGPGPGGGAGTALLRDLVARRLLEPGPAGPRPAGHAAGRLFALHPTALMPYAAPRLLDLDAACAWLAGRIAAGRAAPDAGPAPARAGALRHGG